MNTEEISESKNIKFISIDGDDIGRRITSFYLKNDHQSLSELSNKLEESTKKISEHLQSIGFRIIFCSADGITAYDTQEKPCDFKEIFLSIKGLAPYGISFSAGTGKSLRESYIALMSAKSNGKDCIHHYSEI
jgi:hypothetical protein